MTLYGWDGSPVVQVGRLPDKSGPHGAVVYAGFVRVGIHGAPPYARMRVCGFTIACRLQVYKRVCCNVEYYAPSANLSHRYTERTIAPVLKGKMYTDSCGKP